MRLLYFTRDYTPHDHRFLSGLAGTQHQVFCLRLEQRGPQLEDRPLPDGIMPISWRGGQKPARWQDGPGLLRDLKRVIREVQPDLIHAGPVQSSGLLAALSGFHPLVIMSWGSDLLQDADRDARWRWATRFTLRRADVLVGDCQAVQDKAVQFGFPAERVVRFPWGVDLVHFSPAEGSGLRAELGWQDFPVLLSVRSWEPVYGVDVLVEAFARAAQQRPDLRLLMLGNGSQAGLLRQVLDRAGVLERVHFAGQVGFERLPEYYRAADLYLSASHSDGSSVSLLEALACGLPALVSDIPGNREWVQPRQTGWLFPDGDVEALSQGILRAFDPPSQLSEMGCRSRRLAENRADWSANFQKLLAAYNLAMKSDE